MPTNFDKSESGSGIIYCGPCKPPISKPGTYELLDIPRKDSIKFDNLNPPKQWKPIRDEYRLTSAIEYVCPYCGQLTLASKTGITRYYNCGRIPSPGFKRYGKHADEYLTEKRHQQEWDDFIELIKY